MNGDRTLYFDNFEVDPERRQLRNNGEVVALGAKAFELFLVLIENQDRVVSKDELLDTVWAGQFVEENNLTVHIAAIRKALGEKKGENRYIVTIPGRGYEFIGEASANGHDEIVIESREIRRIVFDEPPTVDTRVTQLPSGEGSRRRK